MGNTSITARCSEVCAPEADGPPGFPKFDAVRDELRKGDHSVLVRDFAERPDEGLTIDEFINAVATVTGTYYHVEDVHIYELQLLIP